MAHSLLVNKKLALIIPVYNEEKALESNFLEIRRVLEADGISCAYMFVDDGSKDGTWRVLTSLAETYSNVSAIRFARNFGKELALSAGVDQIDADYYLTMDSDLQHPPRYIKTMLDAMANQKVNIVEGVKSSRGKESFVYKIFAKSFYKFLKSITNLEMDNSSDFKLMDRQVIDAIRSFKERNLFFRGIVNWVGFNHMQIPFEVEERRGGDSHFPLTKLILLALNAILAYTSKPLYLTTVSGLVFLFFAIIIGVQTLYNYFVGTAISGFSTVILLLLITGSMIMLSLGIIGVYISRIYEEIKGRPRYIVEEKLTVRGDATPQKEA